MSAEHAGLEGLEEQARESLAAAGSLPALAEARARLLGKKSALAAALRGIGQLSPEERARAGEQANAIKARIEALVEARRDELERGARERALAETRLDVTLPGRRPPRGGLHPVTRVERDVVAFFHGLGFSVEEGPEVESQWNNFEALNMPADHPARDMQATFFVEDGHVLRTHTSPVQIRAMTGRTPP
ncbi:MAG TPA: phenylalanine--tRNA ligase subunit alpha, partial [Myxococcota bacterium]|nr:phenylalanine--tRNA ligase subunit alpha [Myxococcota bacterium]